MENERTIFSYYEKEIKKFKAVKPAELKELVLRYQAGDLKAREEVFKATCKLGSKIAHQFVYSKMPIEDLIGIANLAIMNACDKWSESWPNISQFFSYQIFNLLRKELERIGKTVKIPNAITKIIKDSNKELELAQKRGEDIDIDDERFHKYYGCNDSDGDIYDIAEEDEEITDFSLLKKFIYKLPFRMKEIINYRYSQGLKRAEICEKLGISLGSYTDFHSKAMKKLKAMAKRKKSVKLAAAKENVKKVYSKKKRKVSEKTKAKISRSVKAVSLLGEDNANFGTTTVYKDGVHKRLRGEELKQHLADGWKKGQVKDISGEKNPFFGKIYVNNGSKDKRILPDELEAYLADGWSRGRFAGNVAKPSLGKSWYNKNGVTKLFTKEEALSMIKEGWSKGR